MKAIGIEAFGGREQLRAMELPEPELPGGCVRIRVRAAGVNPVDWKVREGYLKEAVPHTFPIVPGWDAAGEVVATGEEVRDFQAGDAVCTFGFDPRADVVHHGAYAAFWVVPAERLARKPAGVSWAVAAALPVPVLTAAQALFDRAGLQAGETVLIQGGAGGVGHLAVQLARQAGAHVVTTASAANHDFLIELGAHEVVDYHGVDVPAALAAGHPDGVHVVLDAVGGKVTEESARVLAAGGRLVTIANRGALAGLQEQGVDADFVGVRPDGAALQGYVDRVAAGSLQVEVAEVLPLAEAARAHEISEGGHVRGKLVLEVA